MPLSDRMRLLQSKWNTRDTSSAWPKFLDWIEIEGIRGWTDQRISFDFPIVAIVGENGSGKSTILQAVASIYKNTRGKEIAFASDYFPDTIWDKIKKALIKFQYKQGKTFTGSIRKPTNRWRGNPKRPERDVQYIDLSRLLPVSARTGYKRLANPLLKEIESEEFLKNNLDRLSSIIGRSYTYAKMALTDGDSKRRIPVIGKDTIRYSGFHQGAGEITITELLQVDPIPTSIILIDEIETSLHPRAQRRLIRDLADKCRLLSLQIILTTHSPYILEELPLEGRIYIMDGEEKRIVRGVSPDFAMTKMDEEPHPECDIYTEDVKASILLREILIKYQKDDVHRCRFISYGAASVGIALGQMIEGKKFLTPSCVYLDGDQEIKPGCNLLPGGDAPERVVFNDHNKNGWIGVSDRIGRSHSEVIDVCRKAMTYSDHHEWVKSAADQLVVGGESLWEALCGCWVNNCLDETVAQETIKPILELVSRVTVSPNVPKSLF